MGNEVQEPVVDQPVGTPQEGADQPVDNPDKGEAQPTPAPKQLTPEEIERKKEKAAKRWEKILHERAALRGELNAYKNIYGALNPDGSPRNQPAQEPPPQRESFKSDEEYKDALIDFRVEQRLSKRDAELRREFSGRQETSAASVSFSKQEAEAKKAYQDYDEVIAESSDVPIPQGCIRAILSSDMGAEIKYYLAKNPDEAYALNEMPPDLAIRKIGMIEGKLTAQKERKPKKSNAPDPINPPAGNGSAGGKNHLDPADAKNMSTDAWAAAEMERMKKQKRR
jgi:hypothetical protein